MKKGHKNLGSASCVTDSLPDAMFCRCNILTAPDPVAWLPAVRRQPLQSRIADDFKEMLPRDTQIQLSLRIINPSWTLIWIKIESSGLVGRDDSILTFLESLSQVFLRRKMEELVKAEQICRTPLKLRRHLQISATAAHFSMTATLFAVSLHFNISEATVRLISLNLLVIMLIWCALVIFSVFIQAADDLIRFVIVPAVQPIIVSSKRRPEIESRTLWCYRGFHPKILNSRANCHSISRGSVMTEEWMTTMVAVVAEESVRDKSRQVEGRKKDIQLQLDQSCHDKDDAVWVQAGRQPGSIITMPI